MTEKEALEIYNLYPRKRGKKLGLRRLLRVPSKQVRDVKRALDNFRNAMEKEERSISYIPYFSTFMGQWEDWLEVEDEKSENIFDF